MADHEVHKQATEPNYLRLGPELERKLGQNGISLRDLTQYPDVSSLTSKSGAGPKPVRRAIVIGSNGPPSKQLTFAASDARRMADMLASPRCGYEVEEIPAKDPFEVRRKLLVAADECKIDDAFLVYFSGHGVIDSGALVLLLDQSEAERLLATALPAQELMYAMRGCKARSRLLILDCCNAGLIARGNGIRAGMVDRVPVRELGIESDTFDIIMASDFLEFAFELSEIGGGVLTRALEEALGDRFAEADQDGDRALSVDEAMRWAEQYAYELNRRLGAPGRSIPIPRRLGSGKGQSYLTQPPSAWIIHEIAMPDEIPLIVLPVRFGESNRVLALGKYPVTNRAYRRFVEATGARVPEGYDIVDERWVEGFRPWDDPAFAHDDQPVVCVTRNEAKAYCDWLMAAARNMQIAVDYIALPSPEIWDTAAFGTAFPSPHPRTGLNLTTQIHHVASATAACVHADTRATRRGLVDLVGNVWEWCGLSPTWQEIMCRPSADTQSWIEPSDLGEIRGGGFRDDLREVQPFLNVSHLPRKADTALSELGFRIAAIVSGESLTPGLLKMIKESDALEMRKRFIPSRFSKFGQISLAYNTWRAEYLDHRHNNKVYRFDVTLVGSNEDLDMVEYVEYFLPPAWVTSPMKVHNRADNFRLKEISWGDLLARAQVHIKNQVSVIELSVWIKLRDGDPSSATAIF
jgi:hypothetical protein